VVRKGLPDVFEPASFSRDFGIRQFWQWRQIVIFAPPCALGAIGALSTLWRSIMGKVILYGVGECMPVR
jgi:hypothetical protein